MSGVNGSSPSVARRIFPLTQSIPSLRTLFQTRVIIPSSVFTPTTTEQLQQQNLMAPCDDESLDSMPRLDPIVETHPRSHSRTTGLAPYQNSFDNHGVNTGEVTNTINEAEDGVQRSRRSSRLATKSRQANAGSGAVPEAPSSHVGTRSSGSSSRKRPSVASVSTDVDDSSESTTMKPPPCKKRRVAAKKPPPNAKKESDYDEEEEEEEENSGEEPTTSCAICMCGPSKEEESKINGCAHIFCFGCIGKWADRENTCPLCKARFNKISRVHTQRRKKNGPSVTNTKRVKQRDQRSDIVTGAALENLLANIAMNSSVGGTGLRRGRFFVARSGTTGIFPLMSAASRTSIGGMPSFSLEQLVDTSDDDEADHIFPGFMNIIMRRAEGTSGSMPMHQISFPFAAATAAAARSYASNGSDPNAGQMANNPLEIDDSEDEDDVEVLQVTRSA